MSGSTRSGTSAAFSWWWVWVASLPLFGWWSYGLLDLDEGYYAAVTAEMNRRHEWLTPYYNGAPWFEKPILLYWFAKPSLMIFGDVIGPRLPSVLASIATLAVVAWFVKRHFSPAAAIWSILIIGSSLLWVGVGRMMLTDPLLSMSLTIGFTSFWESLVGDRRWRIVSAGAIGFGILAKGPVAGLLFLIVVGISYATSVNKRTFGKYWLAGTVVLLAVVGSWYVPAYLQSGQTFVQRFLIEQNIGRFSGGDAAHSVTGLGGLAYYPLILLIGMAPWSFSLIPAWRGAETTDLNRYLKTWGSTILIFFLISSAKLPHYVVPCVVPFAILIANRLVALNRDLRLGTVAIGLMTVLANVGFITWYRLSGQQEIHQICAWVRDHAASTDVVAEYQMSRREHELGTGKPTIQETSEPSTLLYLNRTVLDTDEWSDISKSREPVWVITRGNRAVPRGLEAEKTPFKQDNYRLYRVWSSAR